MTKDVITVLGAEIRAERYAQGLKLNELASRAGVNRIVLSRIERGLAKGTPEAIAAITVVLGFKDNPHRFIVVNRSEPETAPAEKAG